MAVKKKKSPASQIPLAKPPKDGLDDIPDDEKLRLLSESGLLSKIPTPEQPPSSAELEEPDFADNVFFAGLYVVPMAFLYLIMDM